MRREVVLVLTAALLSGCGGEVAAHGTTTSKELAVFTDQGAVPGPACDPARDGFRSCLRGRRKSHPTIERRSGSRWVQFAGPLKPTSLDNEWFIKGLSPDRRTLLAEWLFACDGRVVVFLPLDGGKPRIVTGQWNWTTAPRSYALGWTQDGMAKVSVYSAWRDRSGTTHRAGVYLFDPQDSVRAAPIRAGEC